MNEHGKGDVRVGSDAAPAGAPAADAGGAGAAAFRAFEHAGWEAVPARYDDAFAALTSQAAEPLLDAAAVGPGTRVLDVATGPGYVAAAAAARGAQATGVDFSASMVERARARHPGVEFRQGDAEALEFPDGAFDAVVMSFGLLHLGRPERALLEARRVLCEGGRLAFTVWAPPEDAVGFGIVLRAIETHGRPDVPLPPGPPFFRYSDAAESIRGLEEAGFGEARVVRVPLTWRLPSADALFDAMREGTVRTAGLIRAQSAEAAAAIRGAMAEQAAAYRTDRGVELPMPAVLASGVKR